MSNLYLPLDILFKGGILMWPILACSILGLALTIERVIALRRANIDTQEFMHSMRLVLRQNRVQEAVQICDETDAPVARIMKAGTPQASRQQAGYPRSHRRRQPPRNSAPRTLSLSLGHLRQYRAAPGTPRNRPRHD